MSLISSNFEESFNEFLCISAKIESSQVITDYVEYIIRVTQCIAPDIPGKSWTITKRYSDFDRLNQLIRLYGSNGPVLPPKKFFGNLDRDFIAQRQQGLQIFLDVLLNEAIVSTSRHVALFLSPKGTKLDVQERSLQVVSMEFRSSSPWEVVQTYPDIGIRLRKSYILIRPKEASLSEKFCLVWSDFGTEARLDQRHLGKAFKSLQSLKHPYILPIIEANIFDRGAYVIEPFSEIGSLQDLVLKAKPQLPIYKKYGRQRSYTNLTLEGIRTIAKQILEALRFIHEKGWPYGHLHTRNVIFTRSDSVALTGLENSLLGHSPQSRQLDVQLRKSLTMEQFDIYCFGRCLYEMVFSQPLKRATLDDDNLQCSSEMRCLLECILTNDAIKAGLPNAEALLQKSFFQTSVVRLPDKPSWKITRDVRENITQLKGSLEQTFHEEVHLVRVTRQRRHTEAQIEEEKRQRKQSTRNRRRQTIASASSQQSGIVNTRSVLGDNLTKVSSHVNGHILPESSHEGGDTTESFSDCSVPGKSKKSDKQSRRSTLSKSKTHKLQVDNSKRLSDNLSQSSIPEHSDSAYNTSDSHSQMKSNMTDVNPLLTSIQNFNKSNLKRATTVNDRSGPKIA